MDTIRFEQVNSQLASKIAALLLVHECITLPGFGALIGNYAPAKMHPVTHLLQAPSRQLVFNKSLQTDDGLLTHAMTTEFGLSFSETRELLKEYALGLNERLHSGERIRWAGIGEFREDIERKLQFKPSNELNFLPEAFGLVPVQLQLINRTPLTERRPETIFIHREPEVAAAEARRRPSLVRRAAMALPLILLGGFLAVNSLLPEQTKVHITDFGFYSSAPSVVAPAQFAHRADAMPKARTHIEFLSDDPDFSAESAKIFLVAGCYSNQTNAQGMVDFLADKGFDAAVLDRTPGGLLRVVYGTYADVASASEELAMIKKGLNEEAWMLIK